MSYKFNAPKKGEPLRIPSDKERAKRIKEKGGFDDSWLDKKALRQMSRVHICYWCKKPLKPRAFNHRTGTILMGCDTDDCIGNVETSEMRRKRKLEQLGARRVDAKLTMDLKQIIFGRDPARMWARRDRIW